MSEQRIPELSLSHINQILLIQRQILVIKTQEANLKNAINELLGKIASDLDIDLRKFRFDLDSLKIIPHEVVSNDEELTRVL